MEVPYLYLCEEHLLLVKIKRNINSYGYIQLFI